MGDIHGGLVAKSTSPSVGNMGSIPAPGGFHNATRQLSLSTTTTETVVYSPWAATMEPMCHNYWSPCTLKPMRAQQQEKPLQEKPMQRN